MGVLVRRVLLFDLPSARRAGRGADEKQFAQTGRLEVAVDGLVISGDGGRFAKVYSDAVFSLQHGAGVRGRVGAWRGGGRGEGVAGSKGGGVRAVEELVGLDRRGDGWVRDDDSAQDAEGGEGIEGRGV